MKRFFDIFTSSVALIIVSPLFIPIVILLKLTGEGKVFYIQQRVGKEGKLFGLYKFATMLENSPNMAGGDITSGNDPRVLPMGKFLRKSKINELPQLLNIILGHMSVVGPRPMTSRNYAYYSDEIQNKIKHIKPGLTGVGSIVFRSEESFIKASKKDVVTFYKEDIAPFKGDLEVWYAKKQNFLFDFVLIFVTASVVLFPKNNILKKMYPEIPKHPLFNP